MRISEPESLPNKSFQATPPTLAKFIFTGIARCCMENRCRWLGGVAPELRRSPLYTKCKRTQRHSVGTGVDEPGTIARKVDPNYQAREIPMRAPISLRAVVDELSIASDEFISFLHRQTGDISTVSREMLARVEDGDDHDDAPAWEVELLHEAQAILASDRYITLPSRFDIHEYAIMQRFCFSIEDDRLSRNLLQKIHGTGAFRRFKEAIYERGIADDWYRFRDEALREIAMAWLEHHQLAYVDDLNRSRTRGGEQGAGADTRERGEN